MSQAVKNKSLTKGIDWKQVAGSAAEGAIVGGVGAATAGASLAVTAVAGAAAGAAGNAINQKISTGKVGDLKQVGVSALGGAAGNAGAKLAGAGINKAGNAAAQAFEKIAGNAGKQAAAKAGSSVLGKTIVASAKSGIIGSAAGASASAAMQFAGNENHQINWKQVGQSALLGGATGAAVGAGSQTSLGKAVSASQQKWDARLNSGIQNIKANIKTGARAFMADNRGMIDLKALTGRGSNAGLSESGSSSIDIDAIRPKLKTEPDTAFFWSGRTDGIGGAENAANIAKSRGGVTLESTIETQNIVMPEWDFNNPSTMEAWDLASGAYAEQVSGEIRAVIGSELRPGNIWENVELPRLKNNPNVTKITTIDPKTGVENVIFERCENENYR